MTWLSLLFGSIVGLSLGLTGGGGAVFAVPLLAYGMGVPAREAVAISLVSVGLTSFVGFLGKWREGEAELRAGLLFAIAGMLGAPIGAWIGRQIPEAWLMLTLSVLMLTIAWKMWQKSSRVATQVQVCVPVEASGLLPDDYATGGPGCQRNAAGQLILTSRCARLLLIVGVASGILSGMFGVGGGFIMVPALILFSSMSMSRAVGTSLMVISLVSVSGLVSQIWIGQSITLGITTLFATGGLLGLGVGRSVAHRLSASMLQRVFSVAILLVAVLVIVNNLS